MAVAGGNYAVLRYQLRIRNHGFGAFEEVQLEAANLLDGVSRALELARGRPCELWHAGRRLIFIDGDVSSWETNEE